MGTIVNGKMLRVGDRVRVIDATTGAYGANNRIGTVVKNAPWEKIVNGLFEKESNLIIKIEDSTVGATYWRVGLSGEYELLETAKRSRSKKYLDIDVVIKGDMTKVIVGGKVGIAKCKAEDSFNEAYGAILAIARAYGLSQEKREALVDALYGDNKKLEDYDEIELLNELKRRVVED